MDKSSLNKRRIGNPYRLRKISILAVLLLILTGLYQWNTFYTLESNLTDRLISDTRPTDSHIKILAIDDQSLAEIGRWPWPRDVLAHTVDQLMANGAKAVWVDAGYWEKSMNPREDAAWEQLVSKNAHVYLSASYQLQTQQTSEHELSSQHINWPIYSVSAEQVGHINVLPDRDRIVRQTLLGIPDPVHQMIPSISVRLANELLPNNNQLAWSPAIGWRLGSIEPPTSKNGQLAFSYASRPQDNSFDVISISKVLNGKVDPAYFSKSIVLIGPYSVGLGDFYYTPMSKTIPMYGVEIHANAIQGLLDHAFYGTASKAFGWSILAIFIFGLFALFERLRAIRSLLVLFLAMGLYTGAAAAAFYQMHLLLPYLYPLLAMAATYVASVLSHYLYERQEKSRVISIFGRYVSKNVVNEILSSPDSLQLGGIRKEVTLLFVDIRGFTPLSEKMEPEEVIQLLNEYLDLCTSSVFAFEGTLDKFIGDGVMAIFGAPVPFEDHAVRAVNAALLMKKGAHALAERLHKQYGQTVGFGIGINSGPAVVGNVGSKDRLDYTAIGDSVNLAARLESNAKAGQLLISQATYELIKDAFTITPLEPIRVKGKESLVQIYQVEEENV